MTRRATDTLCRNERFLSPEGFMDFRLTKEQADIQKAAAEFAGGEFDPDLALE